MLARFSVAYERFCRLLVTIFVVNVAILAHTLMGAVVLGFLPSFAAAQATFRAWLLSEDCSMRAKEVWKTFHGFWKSEVKRANLFGWPLIILWAMVIVDYYVMNWHARGDFDIMVSGVLLLIIVVLAVFSSLVWVVRANYEESPVWIVRTTLAMIVARPLCSLLQVGLLILTVLVWVQWSGILMCSACRCRCSAQLGLFIHSAVCLEWTFMTAWNRARAAPETRHRDMFEKRG